MSNELPLQKWQHLKRFCCNKYIPFFPIYITLTFEAASDKSSRSIPSTADLFHITWMYDNLSSSSFAHLYNRFDCFSTSSCKQKLQNRFEISYL